MKKHLTKIITVIFLLGLLLAYCPCAHAQTNAAPPASTNVLSETTNVLSGFGVPSGLSQGIASTLGFLQDGSPYITNGNILIEVGALKHGSHYGGLLDVQVPVNTNSWQMTYGVTAAFLDHQLYSAALSVSLGTTVNIPVVSHLIGPVYASVESGPGWNFNQNQAVIQSFGGVRYMHAFSPKFSLGASYNYGIISDVKGGVQAFTVFAAFPLH